MFHRWIIKTFIWFFKVDFKEAEKDLADYPNLREFFIRKLKSGARPISTAMVVHPCDSKVQQASEILISEGQKELKLIQAKGKFYSLLQLSQDAEAFQKWSGGYFITYYLHPRDYHWVHAPLSGKVLAVKHIAGKLWPVNTLAIRTISNLYLQNARVFIEIATEYGPVGVCLVGAYNVGRISTLVEVGANLQKGDPLGYFNFGSTVVMIYPKKFYEQNKTNLRFHEPIRMGSGLTQAQ